jgi:hypothetical protein
MLYVIVIAANHNRMNKPRPIKKLLHLLQIDSDRNFFDFDFLGLLEVAPTGLYDTLFRFSIPANMSHE